MDKIITLIIILYIIFKSLSHLLSGEEGKKKETPWQPPIPPKRPSPSTPSKTGTGFSPRPDFTSIRRKGSQVLTDLKRQAEMQQEGTKTSYGVPYQDSIVTQHTKSKKDIRKDRVSIKKQMPQKRLTGERIPISKVRAAKEEKIKRDHITFDQPGLFLQGIILSEILRPPMARRNHLLPPYLRG